MKNDLLLQLFEQWIINDKVPDEISIEYGRDYDDGDEPVIYFRWFETNKEKFFGYSKERYDLVSERFNDYWISRGIIDLSSINSYPLQ